MNATRPSPQGTPGKVQPQRQPSVLPSSAVVRDRIVPCHEVRLTDINPTATQLQFRIVVTTTDLRESLRCHGQLEPIDLVGEEKPLRIVDGFRRFHAAVALGWTSIRAFVHTALSEREAVQLAFTKNVVRKNLTPIERANAMALAMARGMRLPELAGAFCLSERQVRRYLDILELPEAIQELLDGKLVTMAHGRILADYHVKDPQEWASQIKREKLDVPSLRRHLRAILGPRTQGRRKCFVLKTKTGIRVCAFAMGSSTPKSERDAAIKALQEAVAFLQGIAPRSAPPADPRPRAAEAQG